MTTKTRQHFVLVRITFDKKTTRAHAVHSFRDCIHGSFYPNQFEDHEPGEFWIKSVKSAKGKKP